MMKRIINVIMTMLVALLVSTFGLMGHVSASTISSHSGSMHHESVSSLNCATICLSAPTNKKEDLPTYVESEREPEEPFYLQFESGRTTWFAEKSLVARSIEEPGKVPKYRLCCVIRR